MGGLATALVAFQGTGDSRLKVTCKLEFSNGVVLREVPVATTSEEMNAGLSNRDDAGQGMLFSWPDEAIRTAWMKDTRVPLSIGFIGAEGRLDAIIDMEPMSEERHSSPEPASDALELAQGQFEHLGLEVGSVLTNQLCSGKTL